MIKRNKSVSGILKFIDYLFDLVKNAQAIKECIT